MIKDVKNSRTCHELTIATVFPDKDRLIEAMFRYSNNQCEATELQDGTIRIRYGGQDYFFTMSKTTGYYDLTVSNAGTQTQVKRCIDAIQHEYISAVKDEIGRRVIESAERHQWKVESDETIDDERIISIVL
ncbi:MAG: hypothetical protein PHI98_04485 [Eubacteriales bacterium]|nr:hypothetical protein [Eubacteriales bacterium]